MSFWSKIKPNGIWFGTLAFVAACVTAGVLMKFAGAGAPIEILVILSTAFGGSIVLLGSLSAQAMTDNPPNHVKEVLDHNLEIAKIELEALNKEEK